MKYFAHNFSRAQFLSLDDSFSSRDWDELVKWIVANCDQTDKIVVELNVEPWREPAKDASEWELLFEGPADAFIKKFVD